MLGLTERRLRSYWLSQEAMIQLFNMVHAHDCLYISSLEGIPEDAKVVWLQTVFNPSGIEFLVYHPSFDLVDEGEAAPRFPGSTLRSAVLVARENNTDVYKGSDGSTWRTRQPLLG